MLPCTRTRAWRLPTARPALLVLSLAISMFIFPPPCVKPGRLLPRGQWPLPQFIAMRAMESMAAFRSHTTREYSVKPGDTFWGIARRNGINLQALMDANPDYLPRRLPVGARLFLPSGQDLAQAARHQDRFVFHWPVGGRITSRYGWRWGRMHQGMDIAAPIGTLVRASAAGKVVFAGWRSGYGLMVIMVHANGWRTGYAHNSRLFVHPGEWVPDGGVLARVGATGHATGVHVHFEVIDGKGHVDPLRVLL